MKESNSPFAPPNGQATREIPLAQIVSSSTNPRKRFDEAKLAELAESIKAHGVLQAVLVRPQYATMPMLDDFQNLEHIAGCDDQPESMKCANTLSGRFRITTYGDLKRHPSFLGVVRPIESISKGQARALNDAIKKCHDRPKDLTYQLVAGERRFRAAKLAGLTTIPATVRELTDKEVLEIQVIENEQREDISPLEKAEGYAALVDQHGVKVEDLAGRVGKSVSTIRGLLRLRQLPPKARAALEEGKLSATVAELIASRPSDKMRADVAAYALKEKMPYEGGGQPSYREVKNWVQGHCMIELKQAPFSQKDAELVPSAGACTSCPKRTGNARDLYPDGRADICTDPGCYRDKLKAWQERTAAAAKEAGQEVLTGKAAEKALSYNGGYYDLAKECYEEEQARRRRENQIERETQRRLLAHAATTGQGLADGIVALGWGEKATSLLRQMVRDQAQSLWGDRLDLICSRRGWKGPHKADRVKLLEKAVDAMPGSEVFGLLAEFLMARQLSGWRSDGGKGLQALLGVDRKVEAEVKAELNGKPPANASGLDVELRQALHSFEGAEGRWEKLIKSGATNAELLAAIGREFGISGSATGPGRVGNSYKGGKQPAFWLGMRSITTKPTLANAALVAKVRELLSVPQPANAKPVHSPEDLRAAVNGHVPAEPSQPGTYQSRKRKLRPKELERVQEKIRAALPPNGHPREPDPTHGKEARKRRRKLHPEEATPPAASASGQKLRPSVPPGPSPKDALVQAGIGHSRAAGHGHAYAVMDDRVVCLKKDCTWQHPEPQSADAPAQSHPRDQAIEHLDVSGAILARFRVDGFATIGDLVDFVRNDGTFAGMFGKEKAGRIMAAIAAVYQASGQRFCRECFCTQDRACQDPETEEPCTWVEQDLCSACANVEAPA